MEIDNDYSFDAPIYYGSAMSLDESMSSRSLGKGMGLYSAPLSPSGDDCVVDIFMLLLEEYKAKRWTKRRHKASVHKPRKTNPKQIGKRSSRNKSKTTKRRRFSINRLWFNSKCNFQRKKSQVKRQRLLLQRKSFNEFLFLKFRPKAFQSNETKQPIELSFSFLWQKRKKKTQIGKSRVRS